MTGSSAARRVEALWRRARGEAQARPTPAERTLDRIALNALGVGTEEAREVLPRFSSFEDLLAWADQRAGGFDTEAIARFEALSAGAPPPPATARRTEAIAAAEPVLSDADLADWDEQGYVVVSAAITRQEAQAAAEAVWRFVGADPAEPSTWTLTEHGIMAQLFQHPTLQPARTSPRVLKAFAQLWGTADLWTTLDRVSFNPPVRRGLAFPGPRLHWDISLTPPVVFQMQGMIYLTDTTAEQGAFELVPGFHKRIDAWLEGLGPDVDPRSTFPLRPAASPPTPAT